MVVTNVLFNNIAKTINGNKYLRILIILIPCIFHFSFTYAQQNSLKPRVLKNGTDYNDMCFNSTGKIGFRVGWLGLIQKTTDGGASWKTIETPYKKDLTSIAMLTDYQTGIIVGDSGLVIRTVDGGVTWNEIQTATQKHLKAVAFSPNGNLGLFSGEGGFIYKSTDKGINWKSIEIGYDFDVKGIIIKSVNDIFIYGQGYLVHTLDNKKWNDLIPMAVYNKYINADITDVIAYDGGNIWIATSKGALLQTRNNGINWKSIKLSEFRVTDIHFDRTMKIGWAVAAGKVYKTTDQGNSWNLTFTIPFSPIILEKIIFDTSNLNGWIAGRANTFFSTKNGGKSWLWNKIPYIGTNEFYLSPDNKAIHLAGNYGNVLFTNNGGSDWTRLSPATFEGELYGLEYNRSANRMYFVGDSSLIASVEYGKKDWIVHHKAKSNEKLFSIVFNKKGNLGYAVGTSSTLLTSSDSGKTWSDKRLSKDSLSLSDIVLNSDGAKGLIVGSKGSIFFTKDGWEHWRQIKAIDTSEALKSVNLDENFKVGFVTSNSDKKSPHLFKTINGGITWGINKEMPANDGLQHINFNKKTNEVITTSINGNIYRSVDLGQNWYKTTPRFTRRNLTFVQEDSLNRPTIAGYGGALIRYDFTKPVVIKDFFFRKTSDGYKSEFIIDPNKNTGDISINIRLIEGIFNAGVDKQYKNVEFNYSNRDTVLIWPYDIFKPNQQYSFEITVFDGWNIIKKRGSFFNGKPLAARVLEFMHWDRIPATYQDVLNLSTINIGVFALLYAITILIIFFISPIHFVQWHEAVSNSRLPNSEKLSKYLVLSLIEHRRSLDAFVKLYRLKAIRNFDANPDVSTRSAWIAAPLELNQRKIVNFVNHDLKANYVPGLSEVKEVISTEKIVISIEGQGGVGKSTFAFQLAYWASSVSKPGRVLSFPCLPIFINNLNDNLDTICKIKVQSLTNNLFISDTLINALLKSKRIVIVIDGLSEMQSVKDEFIDIEKGALFSNFIICTSRKPIKIHEKTVAIPLGLRLEFLDSLLDGFTNVYVGAYKFGDKREVLRFKIKKLIQELYNESSSLTVPLSLLRFMVEKASALLKAQKDLESELPNSIIDLLDQYLEDIFRKDEDISVVIKQLRVCAVISTGLDSVINGDKPKALKSIRIAPKWRPVSLYNKYLEKRNLDHFLSSGNLISSGPVDDLLLKFSHDLIAEYLTSKELVILYRDNNIDPVLFNFILEYVSINNKNMHSFIFKIAEKMGVSIK